jgi:hypothetical protein
MAREDAEAQASNRPSSHRTRYCFAGMFPASYSRFRRLNHALMRSPFPARRGAEIRHEFTRQRKRCFRLTNGLSLGKTRACQETSFPALPDMQPRHWRGFVCLGLALSSCGESDHPTRNGHASGANRVAATKVVTRNRRQHLPGRSAGCRKSSGGGSPRTRRGPRRKMAIPLVSNHGPLMASLIQFAMIAEMRTGLLELATDTTVEHRGLQCPSTLLLAIETQSRCVVSKR